MCRNRGKNNDHKAFQDAMENHIHGQKVVKAVSYPPYGDDKQPFYGDGLEFENGYKYISFGGGCSGEDCNTTYIIDNEDKMVAVFLW